MKGALAEIRKPILQDLDRFESHFKESIKSKTALLDKVTRYIINRKGKQLRPMFVFLCARLEGQPTESTFHAASLVELLHTATLVHDDVVDDASLRRGFFSINALWKNKIAVLVGDYLLSRGLLLALDNEEYRLLQLMSRAVKEMSEGELLQIEKARRLDIKESIYYDIIRQKTASLIAAACAAGVASCNGSDEQIERARQLGEHVGMAFQMKDDLFDYGDADVGKPRGIDIKEKKMTLPIIYTLSKSSRAKKRWIINTIKKHNTDNQRVQELIQLVKEQGGLEYTKGVMMDYVNKAISILHTFPDNQARKSMEQLIEYTVSREK